MKNSCLPFPPIASSEGASPLISYIPHPTAACKQGAGMGGASDITALIWPYRSSDVIAHPASPLHAAVLRECKGLELEHWGR